MFASVQEQERQYREQLDQRIANHEAEMRSLEQIAGLEHNLGFRTFVESVRIACERATTQLVAGKGSDSEMRVEQGRAQAFKEVLELCRQGQKKLERVAVLLREAQDLRAKTILPDGKVLPPRSGA